MLSTVILASGSPIRQSLLRNSGVPFETEIARIDEEPVKQALAAEGASARDTADTLAELKAQKVSNRYPEAFVIGCDQVLEFDDQILSKAQDQDDLIRQLEMLRGNSHNLWSAAVIYQQGSPIWRHVGFATLTMRHISDAYLRAYVIRRWDDIKGCVGGYQIESEGVRLFSRIAGDYFSVLGLPLIEVLEFLTIRGVVES